ncbi:MAG TPA: 8-amino-7-oxononanoate synthase [Steroidobacteraceae bacterium]|nr:8-amino-7-oxononanoate synthase [Steroidobacteraceae bacterium]
MTTELRIYDPAPLEFEAVLAELDERGLRRRRRSVRRLAHDTAEIELDGRRCIDFCSNDYLGISAHPRVVAALVAAATEHGVGARASHLVTGHQQAHDALEEALAAHTGRERALLFSTGYMANLGLATALVPKGGLVLGDALNHASLIDAGRIARAQLDWYEHAEAAALEAKLSARAPGPALVMTDGVFSMDGDVAPVPALAAACRRHGALLAVDDAHGIGVLGGRGGGTVEHFGLGTRDVPALVGTLGKAFGSFGAFVAGDADLIEMLIQRARTYIYTTALPVPVAAATLAALEVAAAESWRRVRVLALAARFRALAAAASLPLAASGTPIQPVLVGAAAAAVEASRRLLERGYYVAAIRPPTVPAGTSRLRVALSAAHRDADVEGLVTALADILRP